MKIRLVTESEVELAADAFLNAFNNSNFNESWGRNDAIEYIRYLFRLQPDLFFVAVDGVKIVGGMASVVKPWFDGYKLTDTELFVMPEYRNMKIGKELFKKNLSAALEKYGVTTIEGITSDKVDFPLTWYKSIGLRRSGLVHVEGNAQEIFDSLAVNRSS